VSSNSQKETSKNKHKITTTILIVLALIAGFVGGLLGSRIMPLRITSLNTPNGQQQIVSSQSQLISSIAKNVSPSVVSINIESAASANATNPIFGDSNTQPTTGAGTGIVLSSDGIIVTNKHVIPNTASSISVTTNDGKKYDNVQVLARDPRSNFDVAFLKISGVKGLTPAKLGDSSKMQTGDGVVAIGYALGEFENTVTSGIISGQGRPITAGGGSTNAEALTNLFQTDAAINPGNSGGPLVNMNSEIIGINTAVAGGTAQNIGFSIPINDLKVQIESILNTGKLEVPYLGVRYVIITPELQAKYNLPASNGAWLKATDQNLAVINGSPADKAGLKEGDIIVKVNGKDITEKNVLASLLGKYKVGEVVDLTINRDGKEQNVKATLEVSPNTN
jgi:serine protease Do